MCLLNAECSVPSSKPFDMNKKHSVSSTKPVALPFFLKVTQHEPPTFGRSTGLVNFVIKPEDKMSLSHHSAAVLSQSSRFSFAQGFRVVTFLS